MAFPKIHMDGLALYFEFECGCSLLIAYIVHWWNFILHSREPFLILSNILTQFSHIMYSNYLFTNTHICIACREKHFHRSSFYVWNGVKAQTLHIWAASSKQRATSNEQQCKGFMCELNLFLVSFTYINVACENVC